MNWSYVTGLVLCLGFIASAHAAPPNKKTRQEKALTLENGIKVFLVSDSSLDRSAAALSVNVGSMDDGKYPGIAHFLEHMLFLGTKKYPKAGAYKDYLSANEGSSNAYTAYDHTNYFFEVKPDAYEGALDRFSRFFIDPTLTDELSAREVNAVNAEHSKNLQDEYWRARQVYRSLINPEHPHNNFATGSRETLSGVQNETLVKFYKDHYSANLMNLVMVSNHSLEQLEKWARAMFKEVPNTDKKATRPNVRLYGKDLAGSRVDIKSIRDIRQLWLRFEIPPQSFDHESKSHRIVGSILGHEGKESLLEQLKKERLATSLSSGGRALGHQGTFNLTLTLTPKGLEEVNTVIERIFAQINLIRSMKAVPSYLVEQTQKMEAINLEFRQVSSVSSEAQNLAASMITTPHENLLKNIYLIQKPDLAKVKELVDALTPENLAVVVIHKGAKTDKTEKHYKTEYSVKPLDKEFVAKLKGAKTVGEMNVPAQNKFIPAKFDLVKPEFAEKPQLQKFEYGEIYLKHDAKFYQPKAQVKIEILNDNQTSAKKYVLGNIFSAAVMEALTPFTYPMNEAGVSLSVSSERPGITVVAGGYNDKLPELLAFAAPFLKECKIDEKRFEVIREAYSRQLMNAAMQGAIAQAFETFREVIRQVHFTNEQQLAVLKELKFADLVEYFKTYREQVYLRGVVYGNMTSEQVKKLSEDFVKSLEPKGVLAKDKRYEGKVFYMKPNTSMRMVKKVELNDSATVLVYQGDVLNDKTRAAHQILGLTMPNRFYQDLRTLQQTGYIVQAFGLEIENIPFFAFLSQSSTYSTSSLRGRFESFIKHYPADAKRELTEAEFAKYKEAIIARLTKKRKTFGAELAFTFDVIYNRDGDFGYVEKQVEAIKALKVEEFLDYVKKLTDDNGVRRCAIEVEGSSASHIFKKGDIKDIKAQGGYHKAPKTAEKKEKAPEKK